MNDNKNKFDIYNYNKILITINEENYNDYFFNNMPIYFKKLISLIEEKKSYIKTI